MVLCRYLRGSDTFIIEVDKQQYRLKLRSLGLTALAERVKLLRVTFDFRDQIGAGPEINFAVSKNQGG